MVNNYIYNIRVMDDYLSVLLGGLNICSLKIYVKLKCYEI